MSKILERQKHNIVFIASPIIVENKLIDYKIYGTGFIIRDNEQQRIISCAHVYNNISSSEKNSILCGVISPFTKDLQKIKTYNFYEINFLGQHEDERADVCCFGFKNPNNDLKDYGYTRDTLCAESELNALEEFNEIRFVGFPLPNCFLQEGKGLTLIASQTIISSIKYHTKDEKIDMILIDRLVNPGSSGSPVFLNGKIIGIASGTYNNFHKIEKNIINVPVGIGIVRASNYILELLDDMK